MNTNEIRKYAIKKLSELLELDHLASSQKQRREFKDAREYLERAAQTGSKTAMRLGSYHFAIISSHIREVQEAKRKGARRERDRESSNGNSE